MCFDGGANLTNAVADTSLCSNTDVISEKWPIINANSTAGWEWTAASGTGTTGNFYISANSSDQKVCCNSATNACKVLATSNAPCIETTN